MNLYHILIESGRLFHDNQNMFTFGDNDKEIIKLIKDYLKNDYEMDIKSISFHRDHDLDASYLGSISVVYITGEDSLVIGAVCTDLYHIYNLGEPKAGIIYPEIGE